MGIYADIGSPSSSSFSGGIPVDRTVENRAEEYDRPKGLEVYKAVPDILEYPSLCSIREQFRLAVEILIKEKIIRSLDKILSSQKENDEQQNRPLISRAWLLRCSWLQEQ